MSLIVQKENCVVEEIKEVELRSRREKFIYNRTYNYIGLIQVSQLYFRQDKLTSYRDCNSKLALFSTFAYIGSLRTADAFAKKYLGYKRFEILTFKTA